MVTSSRWLELNESNIKADVSMWTNPYLCTGVPGAITEDVEEQVEEDIEEVPRAYGWNDLDADVQEEIMHMALGKFRVAWEHRGCFKKPFKQARLPLPPLVTWPRLNENKVFQRNRAGILPGPLDTLTVTFSDVVDRAWNGFGPEFATVGLQQPLDMAAACNALDCSYTWARIKRIRLRPVRDRDVLRRDITYLFEFVQRGQDGEEQIVTAPNHFCLNDYFELDGDEPGIKDIHVSTLTHMLKLRHVVVVDGVDENGDEIRVDELRVF